MPRIEVDSRPRDEVKFVKTRSSTLADPVIPTGDPRHISHVRDGRQSGEIWSAENKVMWHEDYDGPHAQWEKLKEVVTSATEVVPERGEEGAGSNDKTVRNEEGNGNLLREGKRARKGQDDTSKNQVGLQQRRKTQIKKKKAQSGKVTND